jgi:hypothetical protein
MEESIEQEEEVIIEKLEDPIVEPASTESVPENSAADTSSSASDSAPPIVPSIQNIDNEPVITRLTFNDYDAVLNEDNKVDSVSAPKTIERLEEISTSRAIQRKLDEESSDDDDDDRIKIHTSEAIDLSGFEVLDEIKPSSNGFDIPLLDFEELP